MDTRVEVTPRTILMLLGILASAWFLIYIHEIIFLLFIAFIISSAVAPMVHMLIRSNIPRSISILLTYITIIACLVVISTFIVPPLVTQSLRLINNLPEYFAVISPYIKVDFNTIVGQVGPLGQNVVRLVAGIFTNIVGIFTVFVFSFYFTLERNKLGPVIETLFGSSRQKKIIQIVDKIEEQMGAWVRGQLLLMVIIGLTAYLGLTILGVNYALPLAIIAGVLEAVPIIGPNVSAIPAILVALNSSPTWLLAAAVAGFYFVIQQLENNLIVPTVMKKTVGIPPLISLLSLLIGGRIAGVLGAILAIPTFLVLKTIFEELRRKEEK